MAPPGRPAFWVRRSGRSLRAITTAVRWGGREDTAVAASFIGGTGGEHDGRTWMAATVGAAGCATRMTAPHWGQRTLRSAGNPAGRLKAHLHRGQESVERDMASSQMGPKRKKKVG